MAETALGMATTLVGSAVSVASAAAREEMSLLLGVQDDIWYLTYHFLLFIHIYLYITFVQKS
jgi:disease resistance protein RPM1